MRCSAFWDVGTVSPCLSLCQVVHGLLRLLKHWREGSLVQGPYVGWAIQQGYGFWEVNRFILPKSSNHADPDVCAHVRHGLKGIEMLAQQFHAWNDVHRLTAVPPPPSLTRTKREFNLALLTSCYGMVDFRKRRLDQVLLHKDEDALLDCYEWIHLESPQVPKSQVQFFFPNNASSYFLQARGEFFWNLKIKKVWGDPEVDRNGKMFFHDKGLRMLNLEMDLIDGSSISCPVGVRSASSLTLCSPLQELFARLSFRTLRNSGFSLHSGIYVNIQGNLRALLLNYRRPSQWKEQGNP